MQEFAILLPNQKSATYRLITIIILLMNALAFGYLFSSVPSGYSSDISLIGTIIAALSILLSNVHSFPILLLRLKGPIFIFLLAILWLMLGAYWLGTGVLIMSILDLLNGRRFKIVFSESGVSLPSFPPKMVPWGEISNVILKDNVLTLDFKNNKLLQSVIIESSETLINEVDFNEFCRLQLNRPH